jgi:hypothetical protein
MNTYIRNILAVIIGLVVGASVNMSLITLGPHLIPPPAGIDVSDAELPNHVCLCDWGILPGWWHIGHFHDSRTCVVYSP